MQSWIYFVLLSEFMWAFTGLADKIILSKGYIKSSLVFIIFNGISNGMLLFMLPFIKFEKLGIFGIILSLSAGILLALGIIFYYNAVQNEEISRVLILWQFIPIFVLVFSFFFLNEFLTAMHMVGFLFLLMAGFLVSYKKAKGSFRLSRAFYYMLGSTAFISVYYIISAHIYRATGFWNAFIWLRLGAFSSLFLLFLPSIRADFTSTWKGMLPKGRMLISSKMIVDFLAFIILGIAILNGPIALISALGSAVAPIFIFLMVVFMTVYFPKVIKENIHLRIFLTKILAIALAVIGIFFVNHGQ